MKKKYLPFIAGFLITYIIGTTINYFTAERFLIITQYFPNTFQHRIEMSNYNTRWGMIIATIALGIKLTKNWYLQQKENLEIVKRKARTEMQFEKARIHPELLLRSLDTIYKNIQSGYNKAPFLILNLSEVLSYSLYENENIMVLLDNELMQLQHLIAIEQEKKEGGIDIKMQVQGNTSNKYIAPMALVKMLERTITYLYNSKISPCFVELDVTVENNLLFSTLTFSDYNESILLKADRELIIVYMQNVLSNCYAASHFNIELVKHSNRVSINLQLKLLKDNEEKAIISGNRVRGIVYDNL